MEYRRYLMEVVQVLESDQEFRAKLEKANDADIHVSRSHEALLMLKLRKVEFKLFVYKSLSLLDRENSRGATICESQC